MTNDKEVKNKMWWAEPPTAKNARIEYGKQIKKPKNFIQLSAPLTILAYLSKWLMSLFAKKADA